MKKLVYNFKSKDTKKLKIPKHILGGKGANLAEMGRLGFPVPAGFTISTEVCDIFYKNNKKLNLNVIKQIIEVAIIEKKQNLENKQLDEKNQLCDRCMSVINEN